jgi:hypothetical protein
MQIFVLKGHDIWHKSNEFTVVKITKDHESCKLIIFCKIRLLVKLSIATAAVTDFFNDKT